jgi:hypothetical protein
MMRPVAASATIAPTYGERRYCDWAGCEAADAWGFFATGFFAVCAEGLLALALALDADGFCAETFFAPCRIEPRAGSPCVPTHDTAIIKDITIFQNDVRT